MSDDWRPMASHDALRRRARMLRAARDFFAARTVLEVETPILSAAGLSDPNIESLTTRVAGLPGEFYLNTSPEYSMKRLLAAGSGDIYQISRVFRDGEYGRWHNPEFTLIEWYRIGFDDVALMDEVEALVASLLLPQRCLPPAERLTYAEALQRHAGIDVFDDPDTVLDQAAGDLGVAGSDTLEGGAKLDRDAKLDLLMGFVVGPKLGRTGPTFICDYPASQASLARLKTPVGRNTARDGATHRVAARFEFYLDGIELANGFHELADATEQKQRFIGDLATRRARGQVQPPIDDRMLAGLASGLPDCAGVALGFDRLVALALGAERLGDAMAFPIDRA